MKGSFRKQFDDHHNDDDDDHFRKWIYDVKCMKCLESLRYAIHKFGFNITCWG